MATKKAKPKAKAKAKAPKSTLRDEVEKLHTEGTVHSSVVAVLEKLIDRVEGKRKKKA